MKIFIKNEELRTAINKQKSNYNNKIKIATNKAVTVMIELLNKAMLDLSITDRLLNFFGKGITRKRAIEEKEVRAFIKNDCTELNCQDLYKSLNLKCYDRIVDANCCKDFYMAIMTIYPVAYIWNIQSLKRLHEMTSINAKLFCEIESADYELVYGDIK